MKSTFPTQLPIHAPSIGPPQRRAWRNGAIRDDDRTYDGTEDGDNRRHDQSGTATWNGTSGGKSDADAAYIIEIEKLPATLHERRGGERDGIWPQTTMVR